MKFLISEIDDSCCDYVAEARTLRGAKRVASGIREWRGGCIEIYLAEDKEKEFLLSRNIPAIRKEKKCDENGKRIHFYKWIDTERAKSIKETKGIIKEYEKA